MKKKIINILLILSFIYMSGFYIWKKSPISANYYYNKGKLLYNCELYDEAADMFEQASKVQPNNESYAYFYVASLVKQEPTYYNQEKLYNIARSKLPDMTKKLAKSHIYVLRKEFLEGLEDNYILNAIATKEIIHWNLEDFPLKVYIQNSNDVPKYYTTNIKNALKEWEAKSGFISFKIVSSPDVSNIDIIFKDLPKGKCSESGCPYVIGLTEHSISSSNKLDKMVVNIYKTNPVGDDFFESEIYHTALHEIGHALGIMGHSENKYDIMYVDNDNIYDLFSAYRPRIMHISERDLKTLTLLYKLYPTVTNSRIINKEKYLYAPIVIGTDENVLLNKLNELKGYINKYPKISTGYINISTVYAQLGEFETAIKELETAKIYALTNDELFLIEYNSAIIYFNMQKFSESRQHALKALEYKKNNNLLELIKEIDDINNNNK